MARALLSEGVYPHGGISGDLFSAGTAGQVVFSAVGFETTVPANAAAAAIGYA
jgi:hypothetical protein